ncbi:uncharacterized protein [Drosophila kikkawai]|uniref:Uncharacterized protein n=2 Tax=melanogaster group TaxID=32346 RepID=A0A6P4HYQ7_DROKI|nr:uncharacterized protein LOC6493896 [Drosophila ananassae]XP_017017074.1 uncharacterized protein LOC108070933 [Drosophila kikkawai]XP_017061141.1 uncharacterized protein LOC108101345 [Drosophila ficusphila]XP_017104119.1 uncharacterized protein LOC108130250 [Drosophila bipectinata]KAH8338789.1 hypothetical protein KR074_011376 [Drosophila pseudoananassae]EDV38197.1 uncharacterized protein Dana_GF11030 [Drosophila ananassae]KAH8241997.1 hypothetical protein KR026_007495 [Drosophila bipectina
MVKSSNPLNILRSIYNNEFQWMLVKSYGLFFLGVRLAKEFVGVELMPALGPA